MPDRFQEMVNDPALGMVHCIPTQSVRLLAGTFNMDELFLAERVSRLRPTAVNRLLREVRGLEAQGRPLISLMRGQPDSPTPGHIVEAAVRSLRDGRTGYADIRGEPELRQAVADKLRRDQGLSYDPDCEILITDGATCGMYAALGALVGACGPAVLTPDPLYDAYEAQIKLWGSRLQPIASTLRHGRFTLEYQELESSWASFRDVMVINTPWNPVGTVLSFKELTDAMSFAERFGHVVLSDEIYESLVYDGVRHVSPAAVSDYARQRTIVINSLSKTYAMTGWRIGYCAGPEEIIQAMLLILQQSSRGPATFVQDAATCALNSDQACVHRMAREYQTRRDLVIKGLRGIPGVEPLVPEGGLFVIVDVRGLNRSSDAVRQFLLHEMGVVVLHGAAYGAGAEGTLRISFAAGGETLERGVKTLREGLARLSERPAREHSCENQTTV
jgi:aspartate aminotransferase